VLHPVRFLYNPYLFCTSCFITTLAHATEQKESQPLDASSGVGRSVHRMNQRRLAASAVYPVFRYNMREFAHPSRSRTHGWSLPIWTF